MTVTFETVEQMKRWHQRVHEIAPWSWRSDPYLKGMTAEQFNYLRDLDLDVPSDAHTDGGQGPGAPSLKAPKS